MKDGLERLTESKQTGGPPSVHGAHRQLRAWKLENMTIGGAGAAAKLPASRTEIIHPVEDGF